MLNTDYGLLNERFGIRGQLSFSAGPGNLPVVAVGNSQASATIALQGAHVMTWTPRGEQPVLWLSRVAKFAAGKSIRGGVPICWPWFGPHATEPKYPSHGFARTVMWKVIETQVLRDGSIRLVFELVQDDATRAFWPHSTEARYIVTVGSSLDLELVTRNTGKTAVVIGGALHTYFGVDDIRTCAVHGLGDSPYLDMVDGGKKKQQVGPVTINAEVDRIYLDSTADILIDDPGLNRRIHIAKRGSTSSVVWNPWVDKAVKMGDFGPNGYLNMVCVESSNAATDVVEVPAGGEHRLWVRYSVEPLG